MPRLEHQTVRLAAGRHSGPDDGTCVMELASMLAGEPFTDHPRAVCPIIAAFLRTYNDGIDSPRRNDLYRYAADAVGTRDPATQVLRHRLCRRWIQEKHREVAPAVVRLLPAGWRTLGTQLGTPPIGAIAGAMAAQLVRKDRPGAHEAALALVDRLIETSPHHIAADELTPGRAEPASRPGAPGARTM